MTTVELTVRGERILLAFTPAQVASQHFTVAQHEGCGGFVDHYFVTPPWSVLCCRQCRLRVLLPATVETVADLETWAQGHIS